MTATAVNARFWVRVNRGFVKLTLTPGQVVEHFEGGPTEEGLCREWTTWEYDAESGCVIRVYESYTRDCDGPFETSSRHECPIALLAEGYSPEDSGITYPAWHKTDSRQRDHFAEAMGY